MPRAGATSSWSGPGEYYSQRLDRTKPLWEIAVLELSDGRWALVTKTHHCMIDGVGSVDLATILLDTERERPERAVNGSSNGGGQAGSSAEIETVAEPEPTTLQRGVARLAHPALRLGHAAVRAAQSGLQAAEAAVGFASHPSRARDAFRRSKAFAELIVRDELIAAPHTSLNDPIGAKRTLSVLTVELGELKQIKRALGGTVNDVVLASAAGGLRRLLEHRGEEPPTPGLRAMVPMNVRSAGDHLAMGNKISSLFVHLPVAASDPAERYGLQVEEAEALKAGTQHEGSRVPARSRQSHAPRPAQLRRSLAVRDAPLQRDGHQRSRAAGSSLLLRLADRGDLAPGPDRRIARDRLGRIQLRRDPLFLPQRRPRFLPGRRRPQRAESRAP